MSHMGMLALASEYSLGFPFFSVKVMGLLITMPRHRRTFTNLLILQKVYTKALTLDKKGFYFFKKNLIH